MKAACSEGRIALPTVLTSAMRRAVIYQVDIIAGFETLFVLGTLSAQRLSGTDLLCGVSPLTVLALGQLVTSLLAGRWMDHWGGIITVCWRGRWAPRFVAKTAANH